MVLSDATFFGDYLHAKTDWTRAFQPLTWKQEFSRICTFYIKLHHNWYFHLQQCQPNLMTKYQKKFQNPIFGHFDRFCLMEIFSKQSGSLMLFLMPSNAMFLAISRKRSQQSPGRRICRPRFIGPF